MADAWSWVAHYRDGSIATEGRLGTFCAVDIDNCVAVELVPRRWLSERVRVVVPEGAKAVCFRRRTVVVSVDGKPQKRPPSVTVAGWESEAGGVYVYAQEDGRLTVSSSRREM